MNTKLGRSKCFKGWSFCVSQLPTGCEIIRLEQVTFGFFESSSRLAKWLPFRRRLPAPDPQRKNDELDEIFLWWMLKGFELQRKLHKLELEPKPPSEGDFSEDSIVDPCRAILPPEFTRLMTAWLDSKSGRMIFIQGRTGLARARTVARVEQLIIMQQLSA